MTERTAARVILHGAIILMVGLLLGLPYDFAITGHWGEDAVRAWRVAHTGVTAGGVALLAIGGALRYVRLGEPAGSWLVGSLMVTGYGFTLGLTLAAVAGVRGLEPAAPAMNLVTFTVLAVAALAGFAGIALIIVGARATARA